MIVIFGSATYIICSIIVVEVEKMRFCDKLLNLRKRNNFSQEQLAEKLNVSRQAVSKWESGSTYPDMEKMLLLCNILNCTLEELMDDGVIKTSDMCSNKLNGNNWFNDFLKYITNSYNIQIQLQLDFSFLLNKNQNYYKVFLKYNMFLTNSHTIV